MPVSKEELLKDLETPEYQGIVREALSKKDFTVRTKDEETSFQDRFKADVIEKEIPLRIKEVHDIYDKDIKEIFGEDRQNNEKTYEQLKRVGKDRVQKLSAAQAEILVLKEQIKGGDPTGVLKKQLEDVQTAAAAAIKERDDKIKDLETKTTKSERQGLVNNIYAGLKASFKTTLPPLFAKTEKFILDEVYASAAMVNNELVMMNADGSVMKDATFKPVTVESYLKTELKDIIDVTKVKSGAGGGPTPANPDKINPDEVTVENFILPAEVQTKVALMDYMQAIGLKRGNTDKEKAKIFNGIYAKHSKSMKN